MIMRSCYPVVKLWRDAKWWIKAHSPQPEGEKGYVPYHHLMSPRDLADIRLALKARKAAAAAEFERSECEWRKARYEALMAKGKAEAKARGDYQSPNRNPYLPDCVPYPPNLHWRDFM